LGEPAPAVQGRAGLFFGGAMNLEALKQLRGWLIAQLDEVDRRIINELDRLGIDERRRLIIERRRRILSPEEELLRKKWNEERTHS
jgi:hypothetical protein